MCLILFSINDHPKYKLVLMANRDEFFNRATEEAHLWKDESLYAGKDLVAGGTWLGLTANGRFSALTNYRDLQYLDPKAPSRGKLALNFLNGTMGYQTYFESIQEEVESYNGFNLLAGTVEELGYLSNYHETFIPLKEGVYGVSNGLLNEPWPKVERGKEKLSKLMKQEHLDPEDFFEALKDTQKAPWNALPHTGVSFRQEHALSSMFIELEEYGTRCSTLIMVDNKNHASFYERTYNEIGDATGDVHFEIELNLPVTVG